MGPPVRRGGCLNPGRPSIDVLVDVALPSPGLDTLLLRGTQVPERWSQQSWRFSCLLRLTEFELLEREKWAAERRPEAARFPTMKTLETFDFAARPSVNMVLIAELMRCEYIDKKENILVGNPGTGKSQLAIGLAAEACAKGYRVRFFRTTELETSLIEARDERTFLRRKDTFAKLDLLVLDELSCVPGFKVGSELRFDVISTAYERTSLIVTTKLPFESWTEVLGSERLTGTTLDRPTQRRRIIGTKGQSYGLQDTKVRRTLGPNQ